jgi:hypothetical protein
VTARRPKPVTALIEPEFASDRRELVERVAAPLLSFSADAVDK